MNELKILPLASGSDGNCTWISYNNHHILIDCGIPCKEINQKLKPFGVNCRNIEAVLITHFHSDHAGFLFDILQQSKCVVYSYNNELLFNRLYEYEEYKAPKKRLLKFPEKTFRLYDFNILPFILSHDAPCRGFRIEAGGTSYSHITDTGYISDKVLRAILCSDKVLIESNHDVEMLKNGPYDEDLQERILSKKGHLSNRQCAETCVLLYQWGTRVFVLGHPSEVNNTPELAYETTFKALSSLGDDFRLYVATMAGLKELI